ncbi:MAG: terpene cyclase/mutase family protein [Planctomycetaceae bacterium]|nr:terpene cyclase/mutase family protein [Planctomycetaceae bacterium]
MSRDPYLVRLHNRLAAGLSSMSPERTAGHRSFVLQHQQPDGGFRGREGDSDLYYTAFAVRSLSLLGDVESTVWQRLAGYSRRQNWREMGVIDLMNWLSISLALQLAGGPDLLADETGEWREEMLARIERVRRSDGGYAKSDEGAMGSTYHSFLALLSYELLGADIPQPNRLIQFLYDRQRDDGGFVEIAPMRRSGTNPTAAAAASLDILGAMDDELRDDIRAFLIDARGDDGGFSANSRIPFSDGLSTFTGLLTAEDIGAPRLLDVDEVRRLVEKQLEFPTGGFRAATWDAQADVEYTFYGLGLVALLHQPEP